MSGYRKLCSFYDFMINKIIRAHFYVPGRWSRGSARTDDRESAHRGSQQCVDFTSKESVPRDFASRESAGWPTCVTRYHVWSSSAAMMVDRIVAIKITINFGDLLELTLGDSRSSATQREHKQHEQHKHKQHEQFNNFRRLILPVWNAPSDVINASGIIKPSNPLHVH